VDPSAGAENLSRGLTVRVRSSAHGRHTLGLPSRVEFAVVGGVLQAKGGVYGWFD